MARPANRPVCEFCGTTCFAYHPCKEWLAKHTSRQLSVSELEARVKELEEKLDEERRYGIDTLTKLTEAHSKVNELNEKYNEILMEVVNKHEGTSRHDRARFIIRASESWTGLGKQPTARFTEDKGEL